MSCFLFSFIQHYIVLTHVCNISPFFHRFGEPYGPICTLASSKDGHLENKAHTVEIDEYLEKEKERYNNQVKNLFELYQLNTTFTYIIVSFIGEAKKEYMCVYCHMSKKSRVGRSGLIIFFFIIDKTGNSRSGIRFRYLVFENSGKMTNYAVFLPSLLSISTKSQQLNK